MKSHSQNARPTHKTEQINDCWKSFCDLQRLSILLFPPFFFRRTGLVFTLTWLGFCHTHAQKRKSVEISYSVKATNLLYIPTNQNINYSVFNLVLATRAIKRLSIPKRTGILDTRCLVHC